MEVKLHEYNEEWVQLKIERLQNFKKTRDNKYVKESPAIANALGIRIEDLPITPEKILPALRAKEGED